MRATTALMAMLFAVFAALIAPNANAQVWIDPSGRYALDYEGLGWSSAPPQQGVLLSLVSTTAQARGEILACDVLGSDSMPGTTTVDQARANMGASQFDLQSLLDVIPDAGDPQVEHATIDGIELVDVHFTTPAQGGLHRHWRTFYLATPNGLVQHQIHCGGRLSEASADDVEIDALFGTLRFIPAD
jgi:hypothetical protein